MKTWKTQGISKIVKISGKAQGNFNSGGNENMRHDRQQQCTPFNVSLSSVAQGKILKHPRNLSENSGNLGSQKCGHPVIGF